MIKITQNRAELLPLKNICIDDKFWNRYINLVHNVLIPYQWDILNDKIEVVELSHCIKNLKIAAGVEAGEFYGAVFQDTDIAKWIEASSYSLETHKNKVLEEQIDGVIDLIGKSQREDGYFNTYFLTVAPDKIWTNLEEGHELYTAGHLIEAAVAYYKATNKRKFLDIMMRFADLICYTFSDENNSLGYPGHQEIEIALIKLYEITKNKKYLLQAKRFIDIRGVGVNYFIEEEKENEFQRIFPEFNDYQPIYSQSHLSVREQKTAEGHAVRAVYMYCAMADIAYYCKDEKLFETCNILWENIVNKRMYITGGIGSSGILERFTTDYDLPNNSAYAETCASIGLALFGRRMSQITKNAKYYDGVERALYNTLISGVAQDGRSFFYVNPLEVSPECCIPRTSMEHVKSERQQWYGVACCPTNINRTLASIGEYIYFIEDGEIFINLFISNKTIYNIGKEIVEVEIKTNFPYEHDVEIIIKSNSELNKNIAIRIPEYTKDNYFIECDGMGMETTLNRGYIRTVAKGNKTTFKLKLDVSAKYIYSNSKIKGNVQKVAICKGPIIYCIEEIDNGIDLHTIAANVDAELVEIIDDNLLGGCTVVEGEGYRYTTNDEKLYTFGKPDKEYIKFKAIPYGYWGNRKYGEMGVWINY